MGTRPRPRDRAGDVGAIPGRVSPHHRRAVEAWVVRVVPEGRPFIALALLVLVLLALLAWRVGGPWRIGALVWFPVALWVPAFFREPLRQGPRDPRLILAPADGRGGGVAAGGGPAHPRGGAARGAGG